MVKPAGLKKEEIFETYSNHLSSKGKSRNQYLRCVTDFLNYCEGKYDRHTIDAFLDKEKESHGYNNNSLNHIFHILRTVFSRSNLDWPYNPSEAPMINENEINAPALSPVRVHELIHYSIIDKNSPACIFLALSTTYGLRQQEIINLTSRDINLKSKTIYVATLMHGRQRTHLLPDPLIPLLVEYDFDTPRNESYMFMTWYYLERMIGMEHIDHVGWHSIRRTLGTLLLRQFSETTVSSFLRLKQAASSKLLSQYSKTTFVGDLESVTELGEESLSDDQQIFSKDEHGKYRHPFLGDWDI